jgi:hypothetical protein
MGYVDMYRYCSLHYRPSLELYCTPASQKVSVGHVQTISTDVESISSQLMLHQPILNIVVPDSIHPCVPTIPTQHMHLCYTQLLIKLCN